MAAGESRSFRVPIGGYLLVKRGQVFVQSPHVSRSNLEGPIKAAVGGGSIRVEAQTDAAVALGTIRTYLGVVIDLDAGYASDLWALLGTNVGKRPRARYGARTQ